MSDVTANQVIEAFEKHGKEALRITNLEKPSEGKSVTYYKLELKLANGTTARPCLKVNGLRVSGVKDPEQRNNYDPTFTYYLDAEDKNGNVGEATRLICDRWVELVREAQAEEMIDSDHKINAAYKTHYKDKDNKNKKVELEKPLYRVKLRTRKDEDILNCDISYVKRDKSTGKLEKDANGNVKRFHTYEGESFSKDNIHNVLKSGSVIIGAINLAEFSISSYGASLSNTAMNLIIRPGTGSSITAEAMHGANAANDLDDIEDIEESDGDNDDDEDYEEDEDDEDALDD